jgi:hypothetical protein
VKKINPSEIFINEFTLGRYATRSDFKLFIFLLSNTNFNREKGLKNKEAIINHA